MSWQETEFGRVPSDWGYEPLENYLDLITYGFTNPMPTTPNGVYMVTAKEIFNGRLNLQIARFTSEEAYSELLTDKSRPIKDDVLITKDGSIGRVAIVGNEKICISQSVALMRPAKDRISPIFLKYLLESKQYQALIDIDATGSTIQHIYITKINKMKIAVPMLSEQKAIASVLSSLDDKIDLLHRQNKTLEAMAETLFRQWFIEEAKEDWEEVIVSSLFEVRDGTHDSPKQSPIGYPLVTSKHIGNGVLDFDTCYLISSNDYDKVNARSKVETGDILLSMIGTLGRTYLESNEVNYAIKNIGLFKTSQNPMWKYFIYLWLNSVQGKQFVDEHKSGSTQEYLSLGSLRGIQFKSPPNDVLLSFNAHVDNWFKKTHANTKQIQTLENLRDTLLPKLMNGEVRVQYQTETTA